MRLLAILPFSPAAPHGGAALLRSILESWPSDRLGWHDAFGRGPQATGPGEQSASPFPLSAFAARRLRSVRAIAPALFTAFERQFLVSDLVRRVRAFQPDRLLFYGHTTTLHINAALAERVAIPYHLTVHDCPLIHLDMPSGPPGNREQMASLFAQLYRNASSRDVISERMRVHYLSEYGADAVVITKGVDRTHMPSARRSLTSPVKIVLGGAGFGDDLWPGEIDPIKPFLEALALANQAAGNPRFVFHSLDKTLTADRDWIRIVPWMPQDDYNRFLDGMHLGYACDMITPVGRRFAAMSFPTKVVNYIVRGLPFIYHGPADSTVGDLLAEHRCGVLTDSLVPAAILSAIEEALLRYDELQAGCLHAAHALYDRDVISARFAAALGAPAANRVQAEAMSLQ